jgi:hypothetical protein
VGQLFKVSKFASSSGREVRIDLAAMVVQSVLVQTNIPWILDFPSLEIKEIVRSQSKIHMGLRTDYTL